MCAFSMAWYGKNPSYCKSLLRSGSVLVDETHQLRAIIKLLYILAYVYPTRSCKETTCTIVESACWALSAAV